MRTVLALSFLVSLASPGCRPRYSVNPAAFTGPRVVNPKDFITLGPGDSFQVRVFGEPDLSGSFLVDDEGRIRFPLVGRIRVGGLTPTEIEERLRKGLEDGYLRRAQVNVFIKDLKSKKIFVFGEVQKPGTFAFEPNMNIIQAITLAGGFTKQAWKNRTHVTRIVRGEEKRIEIPVEAIGEGSQKNFDLQPGDIIFVPESPL